jgi:asparaginyl-tRNA synthetase
VSHPSAPPERGTSAVQIGDLRSHVGAAVTVRGWVVTTRSSGKIAFVVLRDGSGLVQGVLSRKEVADEIWRGFGELTHEASVALAGVVREEPRSPGGYELAVNGLELLGPCPYFPITPKEHGTTYLFEH